MIVIAIWKLVVLMAVFGGFIALTAYQLGKEVERDKPWKK